jgi:cation:H+ antiporter
MTTVLLFVASFAIIVVAAELFTNAVEWAGYRMKLGAGATGSLLAAIGTSLPEFAVPVVALATGSPSADSVAQGSVLGAPFLLLTLGVGVTGLAVLLRRDRPRMHIDRGQSTRDLGVFCAAFALVLISIALPAPARFAVGGLLLLTYAGYVALSLRSGDSRSEMPEPLHMVRWRPGAPRAGFILLQLAIAVVLLVVGSDLFVDALHQAANALGIAPLILALVAVPVATELPETLNSVLWVRSRDDALALGNVCGSSTFQACVLGFIGVTFTSWRPGAAGLISGVLTLATALSLLVAVRRGRPAGVVLLCAALPWIAYVVAQLCTGGRLGG